MIMFDIGNVVFLVAMDALIVTLLVLLFTVLDIIFIGRLLASDRGRPDVVSVSAGNTQQDENSGYIDVTQAVGEENRFLDGLGVLKKYFKNLKAFKSCQKQPGDISRSHSAVFEGEFDVDTMRRNNSQNLLPEPEAENVVVYQDMDNAADILVQDEDLENSNFPFFVEEKAEGDFAIPDHDHDESTFPMPDDSSDDITFSANLQPDNSFGATLHNVTLEISDDSERLDYYPVILGVIDEEDELDLDKAEVDEYDKECIVVTHLPSDTTLLIKQKFDDGIAYD